MSDKAGSNWFPISKRSLVYSIVILAVTVLMLSPWAYATTTAGGTSWESILTVVLSLMANALMVVECIRE